MKIISISDLDISDKDSIDLALREKLKLNFMTLEKITDKWGYIRQTYMEKIPEIISSAENNPNIGIDPYFIDWATYFSPIEMIAWNIIRSNRKVVFYPQFPLFNYFIDFANPYLKIGLELDGKDYHDPVKDKERDSILSDYGWKIFRVSGKECYTEFYLPEDLDENNNDDSIAENWILNSCHGVIHAVSEVYFTSPEHQDQKHLDLFFQTLEKHKLAAFSIV